MKTPRPEISLPKILMWILVIGTAVACGWLLQPKYHGNDNALSALVGIFSVLAGFLAAIIAIVANDRALKGRTWRQDTYYLLRVKKELTKHTHLFYLYLSVLVFAFVGSVGAEGLEKAQVWIERLLLFQATIAMIASFALPGVLVKRQLDDLRKVIEERQKKVK